MKITPLSGRHVRIGRRLHVNQPKVSVAEWLRLQVIFLLLPDRSITGSSLEGIQCTYLFPLILNWFTVSELIITDLSYFVFNHFSDRFD